MTNTLDMHGAIEFAPQRSRRAQRRAFYVWNAITNGAPVSKTQKRLARPSAYTLPAPWQPTRRKHAPRLVTVPSPVATSAAPTFGPSCQECPPSHCEPRLHGVGRRQTLATRADPEPKTLQNRPTETGQPVSIAEKRKATFWTLPNESNMS